MLGQPVSMLIPKVVGFKLSGSIAPGVTATHVVLTIGNMSPEFGSTAAMFPTDQVTLDYLRLTGRSEEPVRDGSRRLCFRFAH